MTVALKQDITFGDTTLTKDSKGIVVGVSNSNAVKTSATHVSPKVNDWAYIVKFPQLECLLDISQISF